MMTPISRRSFVSGATTLLLASPLAAEAQQPKRPWRIGMFNAGVRLAESVAAQEWFREELRGRGYVQGQNVVYEERWAEGHSGRLPDLAADLVRLNVDVIVAVGTAQALVAKKASTSIPIVVVSATLPG
jgi:putative ABC transport system substrate-binding protein